MMLNVAAYLNNWSDPRPLVVLQRHVSFVTEQARQRNDEVAAGLCHNLGYHLDMIGGYAGARAYSEQELAIRARVSGMERSDTAASLNNLRGVLHA